MSTGIYHYDWLQSVLNTTLPSPSKMLAMYLCTYLNKEQTTAWPSLSTITKQTGLSRSTVCRHFKLLEQQGWLNRKKGNSYQSTEYQIQYKTANVISINNKLTEKTSVTEKQRSITERLRSVTAKRGWSHSDTGVVSERDSNRSLNRPMNRPINNNKKNISTNKFKKPTVKEVSEYCQQRDNEIDANQFWDFYESKHWMIGKNKMKNWQAAVRTWERNQKPKEDLFAEYR